MKFDGIPPESWSPSLLKARVYERLLLDIMLGELRPEARLDERLLAERYGAGLAGVRAALGRLALEGLVVRRARSGTIVSAIDLTDLRQNYEARALIEPHCAALAAVNARPAEIRTIVQAFADGERATRAGDWRALVAMDQRFHAAVARASGNQALARLLTPLQYKATRFWVHSMGVVTREALAEDVRQHCQVAERIAARDAEGARAAMADVLSVTPEIVEGALRAGSAAQARAASAGA